MSDAIARELALEAYREAPVGAEMTETPVSDGTTDYIVRSGSRYAAVSCYGLDDAGADLYLYNLYDGAVWESLDSGAGDADTIREALLDWARAL